MDNVIRIERNRQLTETASMYPPCNLPFRSIKARPSPPAARPLRGFSLIELMVAVAILAILLAIAAPNLQRFIVDNRIHSAASELGGGIATAKMEAVRSNRSMLFCVLEQEDVWSWQVCQNGMSAEDCACDKEDTPKPLRCGFLTESLDLAPLNFSDDDIADRSCLLFRPDGLTYVGTNYPSSRIPNEDEDEERTVLTLESSGRSKRILISIGGFSIDPVAKNASE